MERLSFNDESQQYSSLETAIHVARYQIAKQWIKEKRVLDISCGEGYGSWLLKEWGAKSVIGIDIHEQAILNAKKKFSHSKIEFICGDAHAIPLNEQFDIIVSMETIEHLSNPKVYLSELKRLLKPHGIIIISCPNDNWYWSEKESNPYHHKKYTFNDFAIESESILGEASYWLIGSNVFGYSNYKYDPKNNKIAWMKEPLSTLDITSLIDTSISMCHNQISQLPNSSESVYYVGIWGATNTPENSGTIFPIQPIKSNVQCVDSTILSLNKYIRELEEGVLRLTNNELMLREYIKSLELAIEVLKKDNEKQKMLDQITFENTRKINKRNLLLKQIYSHNYSFIKNHCKDKVILDLGCGTGDGSNLLLNFGAQMVYGVDLNVNDIEIAKEKYQNNKLKFLVGNAEQIDKLFENQTFDIIIINQTLEYISNKIECLTHVKKILAENGTCIISCANLNYTNNNYIVKNDYSNENLIADAKAVFGDFLQVFKSYPLYGIAHSDIKNINCNIEVEKNLDERNNLVCTVIYNLSQNITPGSYMKVVNTQDWESLIEHDYVSEIKRERLIFELKQKAIMVQGLIIENQLLQEKFMQTETQKQEMTFTKKIINKLKKPKYI